MVLHADKPGMAGDLDDFDQRAVRACAHHLHPAVGKLLTVDIIELVAVAMSLGNVLRLVALGRLAARGQTCGLGAQPHGPAQVGDRLLLI